MEGFRKAGFALVIVTLAVGATVLFTELFAGPDSPLLQRALLRVLAVFGFLAVLGMSLSLVSRASGDDLPPTRRRRS